MNIKLTDLQKIKVLCSDDIYKIMQQILLRENKIDRNREHLWTISLDMANKVMNIELVSMGTVKSTLVEPMEVFSVPLQKRAVTIVLVHNHPSGEIKPSENDKDVTDRLIQVGRIMDVPVLDHLIITETTYYSFEDNGLLEELKKSTKYVPAYELKERYEKQIKAKSEKAKKQGEKRGEERGRKEGEQKGKKDKAIEMAKVMKKNGEPIEKIIEYTKLTKAEINQLEANS